MCVSRYIFVCHDERLITNKKKKHSQKDTKSVFLTWPIFKYNEDCFITHLSLAIWIYVIAFDPPNYYNITVNVMWQFMQNSRTLHGIRTKQIKFKHTRISYLSPLHSFFYLSYVSRHQILIWKRQKTWHLLSLAVHITQWKAELHKSRFKALAYNTGPALQRTPKVWFCRVTSSYTKVRTALPEAPPAELPLFSLHQQWFASLY